MKCLVTGAAGFIGSNLVDKLVAQKHKVIGIDNFATGSRENLKSSIKKIKLKKIDIRSLQKLKKANLSRDVDWVFHLAGLADIVPSIKSPIDYLNTNITGTQNILEIFRKSKLKKFIYAASASCYGIPKKFPTKENSKIDPRYPYALSKYLGEELVMSWAKVYKMPNISMRFFNVYGQRSRTTGAYGAVFGVFLAQKYHNLPLTIVGNGKQTRDFIHVDDLTDALIKAAKSKYIGKIYNIGSGKETSVNYITKFISKNFVNIKKRPGEPDRSLADIKKVKKELNWRPKVTISNGINRLLKDLNKWKNAPLWTPKKIQKATKEWFKVLEK
jgi:UDP-glucose 4-epimerase